jgi:hypothetical protein
VLFAWPIKAVPVHYWASVPSPLDLLQKAVLGLVQAGVHQPHVVKELLGIPDRMDAMVQRTFNDLQARSYISPENRLLPDGQQALHDEEARTLRYREGWVLYDQVRGGAFPFVHQGRLPLFQEVQLREYQIVELPIVLPLPDQSQLRRDCGVAVEAHNRRLPLIEQMEGENGDSTREWDRDLDLPLPQGMDVGEIGDVELMPLELVQAHHLVIEVVGSMSPGETHATLHSYSPFSPWEQDMYLQQLHKLGIPAVDRALSALEEHVREDVYDVLAMEPADLEATRLDVLMTQIGQELGSAVRLPDEVVDRLIGYQWQHSLAIESYQRGTPFLRETVIGNWGSLLELSLKLVASEIDDWTVPNEWQIRGRSNQEAWHWYLDLVSRAKRSARWTDLPKILSSNLRKIGERRFPALFGGLSVSSSRDCLVKLMLAILAVPGTTNLPDHLNSLAGALDKGTFPFGDFDWVVDRRNDAAHGAREINELSDEDFLQWMNKTRAIVLDLLRILFTNC